MISALAYPDRVCGIAFRMYSNKESKHISKLLAAMNQHFPALESLELHCSGFLQLYFTPAFLTAQVPNLRNLKFIGNVTNLCRILPYAISLVDLTLGVPIREFLPRDNQLLVHLKYVASLRRLTVEALDVYLPYHTGEMEGVLLPTLTSLSFTGPMALLEVLMAGLEAPSLQELRISTYDTHVIPTPNHLTSFIRNSGKEFLSAQLKVQERGINLVVSTHSQSTDDDLPFKVIASGMRSILMMVNLFSETLATVEDVFLASPFYLRNLVTPIQGTIHSYMFFTPFRDAKTPRVLPGIELNAMAPSCRLIRIDEKEVVSILKRLSRLNHLWTRGNRPVTL